MKKKMMLVNYEFTTGTERFSHSQIISLRFEGKKTEEQEKRAAIDALIAWFEKTYPESELQSVAPCPTIYADMYTANVHPAQVPKFSIAEQARRSRLELPDAYDAGLLNAGQVVQLIEETSPYTDFLVLKNLLPGDIIEVCEAGGCDVIRFINGGEMQYTLITW